MKRYITIAFITMILLLCMSINVFAANESESNNKRDQATTITLNSGMVGSISDGNDVDWYKFTLPQNGAVSISFTHTTLSSTNTYWEMYVYQTDGVTGIEGSSSLYWNIPGNENVTTCEFGLTAGTYYIKIVPYSSSRKETSPYTVTVNYKQSSNYEKEVNNKAATATQIAVNSNYYGAINSGNDTDWYKFTTPSDGKITISFTHEILSSTNTYWEMYVYQTDGVTGIEGTSSIYWNVPGNENVTTCEIGLKAGTYYIKIAPYSSSRRDSSTYTLKVNHQSSNYYEKEINGKYATANTIKVNTDYYGAIISGNDTDWYKFTTTNNGKISVNFSHEVLSSTNTYWEMYIYRDDGVTGIEGSSSVYWSVPGNKNVTTSEIGLPAGTYYIKIVPYSSSRKDSSTYTLKVNYEQTNNYEKEINGKSGTATKIGLMSNYYGAINTTNDADWYVFDISNKAEITVVFSHEKNSSSNAYWEIYSYSSDGVTKIKDYKSVPGNQDVNYSLGELSPGTYYIKVVPYSSSRMDSTTYTINLNEKHDCTGSWKTTSNATCDKNGSKEQTCNICGRVIKTEAIPATGHKYGEWVIDRNPSCSKEGERHAKCSVCGTNKKEAIATLAHTYSDWKVVEEPTCNKVGKSQGTCSECGTFVTEDVAKLTHEYTDWTTVKAATCPENGTEGRECKLCSLGETRNVEAYTHHYGDWEIVGGNKLIPPIVKEKRCELCDDTQVYKDWSYSWIAIVAVVVLIGATIGIVNYVKAFKKTRD